MLELILIRHGETTGNLRPTALGSTDLPLTERGKRQASNLGRLFGLEKPDVIYTSSLKRAKETADVIAKVHGMMAEPVMDLEERNFGLWENLTVEEIRARYPEEYVAWQNNLSGYVVPQGESAEELYNRTTRFVDELVRRNAEGKIIVVTHLNPIRSILAHLLNMGVDGMWHFYVENGRACRLRIDEKAHAVLTAFNEF